MGTLLNDPDRKTAGQLAYEADVAHEPLYHDGTPRKSWDELSEIASRSLERNPTSR